MRLLSVSKNYGKILPHCYLALVVFFWFPCKQAGGEQSLFFSSKLHLKSHNLFLSLKVL